MTWIRRIRLCIRAATRPSARDQCKGSCAAEGGGAWPEGPVAASARMLHSCTQAACRDGPVGPGARVGIYPHQWGQGLGMASIPIEARASALRP